MEREKAVVTSILIEQVVKSISEKNYEQAQNTLLSARKLSPDNAFIHAYQAFLKNQNEDYEEALEDAEKCLTLKPAAAHVLAYEAMGNAYKALKRIAEAEDAFNRARALKEDTLQVEEEEGIGSSNVLGASSTDPGMTSSFRGAPEPIEPSAGLHHAVDESSIVAGFDEDEDTLEQKRKKAEAIKEKEAGNDAYKKKDFHLAIQHYNKAMALDSSDITFLTNRAAVYYEMKQYNLCMEDCEAAVQKGMQLHADIKMIAKAMARKAGALMQVGRIEEAVEQLQKSVVEHRTPEAVKKLADAAAALKAKQEREYIDLDKASQEKQAGDDSFRAESYQKASEHYLEALRRGPSSVNPDSYKVYSNLAACYGKLEKYADGVRAAEECIKLQPSLPTGYARKASIQMQDKDYHKALATYQQGLKHNPENEEFKLGIQCCREILVKFNNGEVPDSDVHQRAVRAARDPEVLQLMRDPEVLAVLRDFQTDAVKASEVHTKNSPLMGKLDKLIAAGAIQMRQRKGGKIFEEDY
ncbi:hypothetical protein CEUSTIGMA_g12366.t1 [Chlamydomonas eustigma]|uniref:STI1 domain-containing protein n=1 Tax=Chlamydomonas eustigma TaxID=1157962 RepID=A0A250XPE4_9CHLO|nr:hypothetical protein CEUSTIGMA_g12366.t1 [Chlamydomonas eustigma]|eukprot:GAX84945.1 hypothetical protein CEUSTIGMA_g12366.t1 [Chlamydomonas eustigma]